MRPFLLLPTTPCNVDRVGFAQGGCTPTPSGLSVYYPFVLVELLGFSKADGHEETGELLLSFLDESGCRVTIKLSEPLAGELARRLGMPPAQS